MANYHPSDELLMQFSAGQMSNALGILVACHLEKCPECCQRIRVYEQLGGEIMQESPPVEVSSNVLTQLLSQLDEPEHEATKTGQKTQVIDPRIPKPLSRFVPGYFDQLEWSGMTRSIKEYKLPFSDGQYTAKLYKISAGKELPVHTHKGNEFTLVMDGSFSDSAGEYHQGDFILADTHTVHQPKAAETSDCICFAVLDAPLRMTGFFGRMLNPFLT
ncbi:ChrR family anti-sigma-E factor [Alkalimarinus alittae]|uniref:ChrR family anti-sigma-E factor n=1 Tax=Alkalimarinus alittae TaxID=2961619 RepID=A0ABY6N6X7_9ALTE|nr:ChrR family anti-sigma-E factor [Alkalimarinus alittae]UZE97764.1 ChrR family anti-sigma-E factor [Alkalimarinus alittae]